MPSSPLAPPHIYTLSLHDALPISSTPALGRKDLSIPAYSELVPRTRLAHSSFSPVYAVWLLESAGHSKTPDAGLFQTHCAWGFCWRSEEHTSELQSRGHLVCRLLLSPPPISTPFPYTTLFRSLRLLRSGGKIYQSPRIRSWYHVRGSLTALFRQYMQYGYWKVLVIRKHQTPASFRHIVPGAFVASLGLLAALGLFWSPASWAFAGRAILSCAWT